MYFWEVDASTEEGVQVMGHLQTMTDAPGEMLKVLRDTALVEHGLHVLDDTVEGEIMPWKGGSPPFQVQRVHLM